MSLDVCTSAEGHFVVSMRELSTGKVHDVECLCDLGLFYTGYAPGYRLLFKDEWELVRERKSTRLASTAIFGGTLVLIAIIGCIVNALGR